jgi:ABC-type glycerol-3-phosphate transport system substrate-binding protein
MENNLRRTRFIIGLMFVILLMVGVGCQGGSPVNNIESPLPPNNTVTPRPSRTVTVSAALSTPTNIPVDEPENGVQTITFWTIEQVSSEAEGEPGDFISDGLRAFQRANTNIKLDVLIKKPSGKGGILDFLRTAKEVAPKVLPDVAIMNATDLSQAQAAGLIQPLDGRLDRSIVQDLLPAARKMGTINEQLLGVPLSLEMEHTVYNGLIFENPPLLWRDVLTANTTYLFPAQGVNGVVNDMTLAQYFSGGGRLLDAEGKPTLDEGILRNVLEFYEQAVENETISPAILEAATTEELWPNYVDRRAGIAQISVNQYLRDRNLLVNTNFALLPVRTEEDKPVLITHSWVLVLTTDSENLQRQAAALRLIEWFMSTSNNASWNEVNHSIPTRDTSYQQLASNDPYWEFLANQLNVAQPQPSFDGYDQVGRIIQEAVAQVISGKATPEEATATAIDALTQ